MNVQIYSKKFARNKIVYEYNYETHILKIPQIDASVKVIIDEHFDESACLKFFDSIYSTLNDTLQFVNISASTMLQVGRYTYADIDEDLEEDT